MVSISMQDLEMVKRELTIKRSHLLKEAREAFNGLLPNEIPKYHPINMELQKVAIELIELEEFKARMQSYIDTVAELEGE